MIKHTIKKGFTVLELTICLGIMGIIATISVPNYLEVKQQSELKADFISSVNIVNGIRQAQVRTTMFDDLEGDATVDVVFVDNYNMEVYLNDTLLSPSEEIYKLMVGVHKPNAKDENGYRISIPVGDRVTASYYSGNTIQQF